MIFSVHGQLKDCDKTKSTWKEVACKDVRNSGVFYKKHPMEVIIYYLYSIYFINLYMCLAPHLYFYYFQATFIYDN